MATTRGSVQLQGRVCTQTLRLRTHLLIAHTLQAKWQGYCVQSGRASAMTRLNVESQGSILAWQPPRNDLGMAEESDTFRFWKVVGLLSRTKSRKAGLDCIPI